LTINELNIIPHHAGNLSTSFMGQNNSNSFKEVMSISDFLAIADTNNIAKAKVTTLRPRDIVT
jgi:hypothetical protein